MNKQFIKNFGRCALILMLIFTIAFAALLIVKGFDGANVASASTDEIFYGGGDLFYDDQDSGATSKSERFNYATYKIVENFSVNPSFPDYVNYNGQITNGCASIAGTNIIGYYTKDYSELIPNCNVGTQESYGFSFNSMATDLAKKQAVINDLYVRMQTNTLGAGATQTQYKDGLSSYVQDKGRNISFTSVMSNSKLDINKVIAQLKLHNPVSLYLSKFGITGIYEEGDDQIYLYTNLRDANHIAIAYGYEVINYYDANGKVVRTLKYFLVSTGIHALSGVYLIDDYGTLNDAEAVHIS